MKHYVYESLMDDGEEYEFVIFAQDDVRGAELLCHFRERLESLPGRWFPEVWENFDIFGTQAQLDEALARNQEGLGYFNYETGWAIYPPDPGV